MTSPTPDDDRDRRNKLVGRIAVVALLLLVAVYLVPLFLNLLS